MAGLDPDFIASGGFWRLRISDLEPEKRHRSFHARNASRRGLAARILAGLPVLFLLWQPALSIATLRPQQNIVAVVIDDSKSMAVQEDGVSRKDQVVKALNGGLIKSLQSKFQVRLYRFGDHLQRLEKLEQLTANEPATRIGDSIKDVLADSATLPIGAVVLLSDGADNSGGIDLETISEIKRQRIPIHTIGFGREKMEHDIELTDVQLPAKTLAKSRLEAEVSFRQSGFRGAKARLVVRDSGKFWPAATLS